jgi:hypothetical protein
MFSPTFLLTPQTEIICPAWWTVLCEERDLIFGRLSIAVQHHMDLVAEIVKMMDSGRIDGLLDLLIGAAEAKANCDSVREELDSHCAQHLC